MGIAEKVKDDGFIRALHGGYTPDAKLKKELGKRYYSASSDTVFYEISVPVDYEDMEKADKTGEIHFFGHNNTTETLHLRKDIIQQILKEYPKACEKCGYSRYHVVKITSSGLGSFTEFECPYCYKKTTCDTFEG